MAQSTTQIFAQISGKQTIPPKIVSVSFISVKYTPFSGLGFLEAEPKRNSLGKWRRVRADKDRGHQLPALLLSGLADLDKAGE